MKTENDQINLLNHYGTEMILRRVPLTSLFEIVEESTMKIKCCLTRESAIEFIRGNITIFDSRGLPFNYKTLEEEMLCNTQSILDYINEK